jgi:hypothetical protein
MSDSDLCYLTAASMSSAFSAPRSPTNSYLTNPFTKLISESLVELDDANCIQ